MESDAVADLLRRTAERLIMPRFRALSDGEIFEKGPDDLVTVADREAEVAIAAELLRAYPGALVLGEEATAKDPSLLDRFRDAEHVFTVDPVDGTHNFVNGVPDYAVMVAELRSGETIRSWILQPEHGMLFAAEKGAGAWRDGSPLPRLTPDDDPQAWRGNAMQPALRTRLFEGIAPIGPIRSCAGVDYSLVAQGTMDFIAFSHGHPWDHAPGSLLVSEVGGTTLSAASPYSPAHADRRSWVLSAASARVAEHVARLLGDAFDAE